MAEMTLIAETEPLLTEDKADAVCICSLCGRMYKVRPFLCLCKSNVFLRDTKLRHRKERERA